MERLVAGLSGPDGRLARQAHFILPIRAPAIAMAVVYDIPRHQINALTAWRRRGSTVDDSKLVSNDAGISSRKLSNVESFDTSVTSEDAAFSQRAGKRSVRIFDKIKQAA